MAALADTKIKADIHAKLHSGEAKIERKKDGKSEVWQRFGQIVLPDDTISDYAACLKCEALYKYDSHKIGTSCMKRHSCPGVKRVPLAGQPLASTFVQHKVVPHAAKSKLVDDFVDFCCADLRPFDIVSGKGFNSVAQGLINIGAKYGAVAADAVIPHRQTISDRAKAEAKKKVVAA